VVSSTYRGLLPDRAKALPLTGPLPLVLGRRPLARPRASCWTAPSRRGQLGLLAGDLGRWPYPGGRCADLYAFNLTAGKPLLRVPIASGAEAVAFPPDTDMRPIAGGSFVHRSRTVSGDGKTRLSSRGGEWSDGREAVSAAAHSRLSSRLRYDGSIRVWGGTKSATFPTEALRCPNGP
jgi:hypothetical protein